MKSCWEGLGQIGGAVYTEGMGKLIGIIALLSLGGCEWISETLKEQGSASPAQVWPDPVRVAVTPYYSAERLQREFVPLLGYLEDQFGSRVEMVISESYAEYVERIQNNEFDIAIMSPLSYVSSKAANPAMVLIASIIVEGSTTYDGYVIARKDSNIKALIDLKGKRFGYVARQSASGYLYPLAYLRESGIEPDSFFGNVEFVGDHEAAIAAVLNGKVDAATTFSGAFITLAEAKPAEARQLEVIARTGKIPYDAIGVNPAFSYEETKAIQQFFLTLTNQTPLGKKILGGENEMNGFVNTTDSHYDEVRRVLQLVTGRGEAP